MSSGKFKPHHGFNKTQIRDGYIVILHKDGRVRVWKDRKTGEIVKVEEGSKR